MAIIPILDKPFKVYGSPSIFKFKESKDSSKQYELFIFNGSWNQLNSIREEDSVWWYIKGNEWEYVDELSVELKHWSDNINNSLKGIGISAKRAADCLKVFSRITSNENNVTGNKRSGSLDRQQAFGKLFK
ncbi:hypothetical protein P7H75_14215 [Vagococcus carniphilus]|uniref:hypothetical protein n=1 Tax=Vagococcus carniphilus TaxID=218144 RepID=UPI00288F37AC|nr:hypothetical protein [Vagococcus carniphilus]MDT2816011.1 hypothetical protein [Vagococcus carniphilus]